MIKFSSSLLSSVMLLMTVFYSCSDDKNMPNVQPDPKPDDDYKEFYELKHESGEGYDVEYKFKQGVTNIDDKKLSYLLRIESDSIIIFSSSMPVDELPSEGDILSCSVTEKTPYGLGNIVESVSSYNGEYRCVTTVAPLEDLFEKLELTASIPLLDNVPEKIYDEEGNEIEYTLEKVNPTTAGRSIGFTQLSFNPKIELSKEFPVFFSGKCSISPSLDIDINLSKKRFNVELDVMNTISAEIGLRGKLDGSKTIMGPFKIVDGRAVVGPVLIPYSIEAQLDFEGEIEGEYKYSYSYETQFRSGFKDGEGFVEKAGTTGIASHGIEVNAKGTIGLRLNPRLSLGLYTKALTVGLKPSAKFDMSLEAYMDDKFLLENNPILTVDCHIDVDGDAQVKWGKKTLWENEIGILGFSLLNWTVGMFPSLEDGSFKLSSTNKNENAYKVKYSTNELGFLATFLELKPGIAVLHSGETLFYKFRNPYNKSDNYRSEDFDFSGIDISGEYEIRRCIKLGDFVYLGESISINELVGTWRQTYEDGYSVITFEVDGTYTEEDHSCGVIDKYYGTYDLDTAKKIVYKHCQGGSDGKYESEFYYKVEGDILSLIWTDGDHGWSSWKRVTTDS